MAAPPSDAGAVKERLTLASPGAAATAEGEPGTVADRVLAVVGLLSEPPQAARVAATSSGIESCRRGLFMVVAEEALGRGKSFCPRSHRRSATSPEN
jgi:hypothetical protein